MLWQLLSAARLIGFMSTPGFAQNIVVMKDTLFVSDGAGGLIILHMHK
jgi:hypothetical protein